MFDKVVFTKWSFLNFKNSCLIHNWYPSSLQSTPSKISPNPQRRVAKLISFKYQLNNQSHPKNYNFCPFDIKLWDKWTLLLFYRYSISLESCENWLLSHPFLLTLLLLLAKVYQDYRKKGTSFSFLGQDHWIPTKRDERWIMMKY